MPDKFYGYEVRSPYEGEVAYFRGAPHVAGMATEDGKIILNPFSPLSQAQRDAVARNEASRLYMRDVKYQPKFQATEEQKKFFANTEYGKPEHELDMKHTILARILSGDESVIPTQQQQVEADNILRELSKRQ